MTALLSQLSTAKNGLEDAQIALYGAVTAHAEAKRVLELGEAIKLCDGVDGKNERNGPPNSGSSLHLSTLP